MILLVLDLARCQPVLSFKSQIKLKGFPILRVLEELLKRFIVVLEIVLIVSSDFESFEVVFWMLIYEVREEIVVFHVYEIDKECINEVLSYIVF